MSLNPMQSCETGLVIAILHYQLQLFKEFRFTQTRIRNLRLKRQVAQKKQSKLQTNPN